MSVVLDSRNLLMSAQFHQSAPRILSRRTLERDHRVLAGLLRQGDFVLDVGCGTGAITAGIAAAVGPSGFVTGMDRDEGLLEIARQQFHAVPNLKFEAGDAVNLRMEAQFDVVTAARVLQWISQPDVAIARMKMAARPSGMVVVLDYNHSANGWTPDPPIAFQTFYQAFLDWRSANGWDNRMADRLPRLFEGVELLSVTSHREDEIATRGDPLFDEQALLWIDVMQNLGGSLIQAGYLTASQLEEASEHYALWAKTVLREQVLSLKAVTGRVPG